MRVVLDTNVLVSSLLGVGETMSVIRTVLASGRVELSISPEGLREFERTIAKPKLAGRLPKEAVAELHGMLEALAAACPPLDVHPVIDDDPDDDMILATAVASGAEVIVSGDRHLLALQECRGIRILSPQAFVAELSRTPAVAEAP